MSTLGRCSIRDNFVLSKVDDNVVLDPNTFDLIVGEAKGGPSRLGGIWRKFVGGKRYLQQMGSDGDWVRDVIRRMRQHGDESIKRWPISSNKP